MSMELSWTKPYINKYPLIDIWTDDARIVLAQAKEQVLTRNEKTSC